MDRKHIQHLYLRAGFGFGYENLKAYLLKSQNEWIPNLFSESKKSNDSELDLSEFYSIINCSLITNVYFYDESPINS